MERISAGRRRFILREARRLRARLVELCPTLPFDPLELIEPRVIITEILGLHYSEPEEIPSPPGHGKIAGSMDRSKKEIAVVQRQRPEVKRFTSAHEIGHWILHTGTEYFRDAPIDGSDRDQERPIEEREADLFAAALLMPTNFVRSEFRQHFRRDSLAVAPIDEDLITLLVHGVDEEIRPAKPSALRSTRQISKLAAQCLSVWRPGSPSLAKRFKVSPGAMAIRLEELKLVPILPDTKEKEVVRSGFEGLELIPPPPAQRAIVRPSPEPEIYDAFISYRREDRVFVERLVAKLRKRGLNPWFDGLLVAGTRWRREIDEAVMVSRSAVILLGPLGCEGYQDIEIEALIDEFLEKRCPIIPAFIPGWTDEMRVPFSLKAFQRVDFREAEAEALEKLIQGITGGNSKKSN